MAQATKTQEPAKFQPVTITLVLETQEELRAIEEISAWNESIPMLVTTGSTNGNPSFRSSPEYRAAYDVLKALHKAVIGC